MNVYNVDAAKIDLFFTCGDSIYLTFDDITRNDVQVNDGTHTLTIMKGLLHVEEEQTE